MSNQHQHNRKFSLVGVNGNAFSIMAYVIKAMKECHCTKDEIKSYQTKAMSSDYTTLVATSMDPLEVLNQSK